MNQIEFVGADSFGAINHENNEQIKGDSKQGYVDSSQQSNEVQQLGNQAAVDKDKNEVGKEKSGTQSTSKNRHHAKSKNKSGKKDRENKSRSIGHYLIGKTIGEGTFGKVKLGTHNLTGEKVAVKILEKHKIVEDVDVERVTREIKILKLARHPNIIQLYEIIETPRQLYLITEYVPGGELFDYIVKHQKLKEEEACKFYQQIISGIQYLHELGIVHRDMKPENLLLDHDGQIKLVDFGLSNTYKENETLKTACGSPCYAAPEMIAGDAYHGAKVDIWSCGVILFAMVCGYLPFEDPDTTILYKKIMEGKFEIPNWVSEGCSDLINKILNIDPVERYTADQIVNHSWYVKTHTPVIKNLGLIIGKNKIPLEQSIVGMLKQYGFKQEEAEQSLNANKHNQVTTVYYLLHKRYEKLGKLPSHFNIINKSNNGGSACKPYEGDGGLNGSIDFQDFNQIKIEEIGNEQETPRAHKKAVKSYDYNVKTPKQFDDSPGLEDQALGRDHDNESDNSTKVKKMDSQRAIELSCSPVKRGRKAYLAAQQTASGKSSDMSQKVPEHQQDEIEKHIMRAKQIEEKGSRSPDKKRRRAPKINESDEQSDSNKGLVKFNVQEAAQALQQSIDRNKQRLYKQETSTSSIGNHLKGSAEDDVWMPQIIEQQNVPQINEEVMQKLKLSFEGTDDMIVESLQQQQQQKRSHSPKPKNACARQLFNVDNSQKSQSAAKEYERKIIQQKNESYKYRHSKDGDKRSIDDKIKTKQLLKNIDLNKLFNRRSLLSPGGAPPVQMNAPKTTTMAQIPNMISKQNKRASSIDETNIIDFRNKSEQQHAEQIPQQPTDSSAEQASSHFIRHHKTDQTQNEEHHPYLAAPKKVLKPTVKGSTNRENRQQETDSSIASGSQNWNNKGQRFREQNQQQRQVDARDIQYQQQYAAANYGGGYDHQPSAYQGSKKMQTSGYQTAPQRIRNNFKRNVRPVTAGRASNTQIEDSNNHMMEGDYPISDGVIPIDYQKTHQNYYRSAFKTRSSQQQDARMVQQNGFFNTEQTPNRQANFRSRQDQLAQRERKPFMMPDERGGAYDHHERQGRHQDSAPLRHLNQNHYENQMHDPQGYRKRLIKQQESSGNIGYNYQMNNQHRQDPINFTNQYNIYNPVIGGPITSAPLSNSLLGPQSPHQNLVQAMHNPYQQNQQQFSNSLSPLLSQPPLSSHPHHHSDNQAAFAHQLQQLQQMNLFSSQQINPQSMAALMQFRDLQHLAPPQYPGPSGYNDQSMLDPAYRSFNPTLYASNLQLAMNSQQQIPMSNNYTSQQQQPNQMYHPTQSQSPPKKTRGQFAISAQNRHANTAVNAGGNKIVHQQEQQQ